jgi:hypothetical protein
LAAPRGAYSIIEGRVSVRVEGGYRERRFLPAYRALFVDDDLVYPQWTNSSFTRGRGAAGAATAADSLPSVMLFAPRGATSAARQTELSRGY